jgi:F-type H+-transporting ATPase subunit b
VLIDWFTIVAQIVNFLILVLLLRKFLYKPILNVMREREERIRSQLNEAEELRRHAEEQIEIYQEKNEKWKEEHDTLLQVAKAEIDDNRKLMMKKVRDEIDEHKTHWEQAIEREKKEFLDSLRKKINQQTFIAVRRVLNELANVELEAHICNVFLDRLQNMDQNQVEEYRDAIMESEEPVIVRSAFELTNKMKKELQSAVETRFLNGKSVDFEIDPDLVCGIEMKAAGYKLTWSLSEYLERLEDLIEDSSAVKVGE